MDTTDKELQAQFDERNRNLKHSIHDIVDTVDHAIHEAIEETKSAAGENKDTATSAFTGSGIVDSKHDHRWSHTGVESPLRQNIRSPAAAMADGSNAVSSTTAPGVSREQTSFEGSTLASERMGYGVNKSAMDAIERDIEDMHKSDAEGFESVAAKFEETFGNSALSDHGPDRSGYNF
ncbi:hypothetical protein BX666DRAFT_1994018 [Dichotomocladium elegans]|nr:hypothetical protein BX666DRAFT_1994018 [Dichotomocladium elegans]